MLSHGLESCLFGILLVKILPNQCLLARLNIHQTSTLNTDHLQKAVRY